MYVVLFIRGRVKLGVFGNPPNAAIHLVLEPSAHAAPRRFLARNRLEKLTLCRLGFGIHGGIRALQQNPREREPLPWQEFHRIFGHLIECFWHRKKSHNGFTRGQADGSHGTTAR